jgi:hypothetical protein
LRDANFLNPAGAEIGLKLTIGDLLNLGHAQPNLVGEDDPPDRYENVPDVEFSFLFHVSACGAILQLINRLEA